MSRMYAVCYGSNVFHRVNCPYVSRMKPKNMLSVSKADAIDHDCRICRYCSSINYHMKNEECTIINYEKYKGMKFKYMGKALYVKTDIGCWKIACSKNQGKMILFHMNVMPDNYDFDRPDTELYHLQKDAPAADTIAKYLNYIFEHDRYKGALMQGKVITNYTSKRARILAIKSEKKRSRKNVRNIFDALEKEHPEYKQLSYC